MNFPFPLLLSFCSMHATISVAQHEKTTQPFPSEQICVLSEPEALKLAKTRFGEAEQKGISIFQPTSDNLNSIASLLPEFISIKSRKISIRLNSYYIQVIGIRLKKSKFLFIHAIDKSIALHAGVNWNKRAIIVADGDEFVWNVRFDPNSNRFTGLSTNGPDFSLN